MSKIWNPFKGYDITIIDDLFAKKDLEVLFGLCSEKSPYYPLNYDNDFPSAYSFFIKPKNKSPLFPREKYQDLIGAKSEDILSFFDNNVLQSSFFDKKKITLYDAYINMSNTLDSDLAHVDVNDTSRENKYYTLIFYTNMEWDVNWGGETLFYDSDGEEIIAAIRPKPGRTVIFNSSLYHSARPPQSHCPRYRYTIVLKLMIENE